MLAAVRPRALNASLSAAARQIAGRPPARAGAGAHLPACRCRACPSAQPRGWGIMAASLPRCSEGPASDEAGDKITAGPAERNKEPILAVLKDQLGTASGLFLEVASGTGQHCAHFAAALPGLTFQPSERDPVGPNMQGATMASILAWTRGLPNVQPPVQLDVTWPPERWPVAAGSCRAVFVANMLHVSPWEVTAGLLAGAGHVLQPGGLLLIYGPFLVDGQPTTPSNADFHARLLERGPGWGYKDVGAVAAAGAAHGLALAERRPMPADNFTLILRKQ